MDWAIKTLGLLGSAWKVGVDFFWGTACTVAESLKCVYRTVAAVCVYGTVP